MTPLLRQLYVIRRRKRIKIARRNQAAKKAESRAIQGAKEYRAQEIVTWCDEVCYREEFRVMRDHFKHSGG